jgi:hypothetical protein
VSGTDAIYRLLQREGSRGVHTLDLRREGFSGNPSQRATDIEKKYGVRVDRQIEYRGKKRGSRFRLVGVGVGQGQGSRKECFLESPPVEANVDSDAKPAGEDRLFEVVDRPLSAFTDAEAA